MLIGAGLSIIFGKVMGWVLVGCGVGLLVGIHLPKAASDSASISTLLPESVKPAIAQEPNLKAESPQYLTVYLDSNIWTQHPLRAADKSVALVVPIRNEPKQQGHTVAEAIEIKARLVWYVNGKERCTSYPCAWLDEPFNRVDIGAGSKILIVVIAGQSDDWSVITHNREREAPDGSFYRLPAMKFDMPPHATESEKGKVELQLLEDAQGRITTLNTFLFDWVWGPDDEGGQTQTPYLLPRKFAS